MSAESDAQPQATPLQFDHAVHADPSAAQPQCAACSTPIADAYYHDGGVVLCQRCGEKRQQDARPDRGVGALGRAVVYGGGAAIVGAVLYWAVMEYLNAQIGIVAIATGWVVGRAIMKATRGRSARRHQLLALGFTYLSVAMAYAPFAIKELSKDTPAAATADSTASPAAARADSAAGPAVIQQGTATAVAPDAGPPPAPTAGAFAIAMLLLFLVPLVAALGSMPGGILSLLIIGFGLRQAWTITVAGNATVTGPHAMGAQAAA